MPSPAFLQEDEGLFPKDADDKLIPSDVDYLETWEAFEEFVDEGLVKAIGLSNFNSEQITRVLDKCRIKPTMNQVSRLFSLPTYLESGSYLIHLIWQRKRRKRHEKHRFRVPDLTTFATMI